MENSNGQGQGLKPTGRPSSFTQETADLICTGLMEGHSLRALCRQDGMPSFQTVFNWLNSNRSFFEQYARARDVQAEILVDEMFEIADDGSNDWMTITKGDKEYNVVNREAIDRSKVRVDVRKWFVSKVLPKKYGEKLSVEHDVSTELAERMLEAQKRLDANR